MVKTVVGTSSKTNMTDAVGEACRSINDPKLLIVFVANDKLKEVAELLAQRYPKAQCIGSSGTSFYNGKDMGQQLVITAFLSGIEAVAGVIEHVSTMPLLSIESIQKNVSAIAPGTDNTVCIEFCTNSEEKLVTTLSAGIGNKKVSIIGGTVFGYAQGECGHVCVNGKTYDDACAYVLIRNTTGKIKTYRENIYGKYNDHVHIATKVNREKRELIQLDGRSTADVYTEETGIARNKIVDSVLEYPLGRLVGDEMFIASMYEIGNNGSFINYKQVNENDTIYVLQLLDYQKIMQDTLAKIKAEMGHISLVLSADCVYRYMLFGNKNYLETYLKDMSSLGEHVGIVAGGEQYNNQHVNQTMVCSVFE